jgi:hypothetical protein
MVCGMEKIELPSPRSLNEKFSRQAYLTDFAESTGLVKRVGGKELSVDGVKLAIKTSVVNYQHDIFRKGGNIEHLQFLEQDVKDIIFDKA